MRLLRLVAISGVLSSFGWLRPLFGIFLAFCFQGSIRSTSYFSSVFIKPWSNALLEWCSPLDCSPVLFGWASTKVANIFCLISVIVIFLFWIESIMLFTFRKSTLIYLNLSSFGRAFIYTFGRWLFGVNSFTFCTFIKQIYFWLLCDNYLVISIIKCKISEVIFIKFY